MNQASLFLTPESYIYTGERCFEKNIIEDRGSKYSILFDCIPRGEEPKKYTKIFSRNIRKDSFFRKATHNSYARRSCGEGNIILEGYVDDGEKGAGLCILRELRKHQVLNLVVVVTRYFGGVKLEGDRFRHVIDATQYAIGQAKGRES